jgi:two-component system OmpR family response regulator
MVLEAPWPWRYTVAMIDHGSPYVSSALSPAANLATATPVPRVWVLAAGPAEDASQAWCEALRGEGLRVDCSTRDAPPEPGAAQAAVLHCTQRLAERLATLRELRSADPAQPLVVVCQDMRDLDQVLALELGADDAIDARASAPVVAARLRALWRRGAPGAARGPDRLVFGRLSLHLRERRVQLGAEPIELTECEFEVLWLLAAQAGRAVSRSELLERVRGLPYQRIDRSIDCRVYRIRAKLRDGEGAAQHIRTVRNCGYLFSPSRW